VTSFPDHGSRYFSAWPSLGDGAETADPNVNCMDATLSIDCNLLFAHFARMPPAVNGVAESYDMDGQAE